MTKVEEVADALDKVPVVALTPDFLLSEVFSSGLWDQLRIALARVAIEAMREPTRKMYDAYVLATPKPDADGNRPKCSRRQKCTLRFNAMIDAARVGK